MDFPCTGQKGGSPPANALRGVHDEDADTDKLPVTSGAIVPARELLGEMLLYTNQAALALEAFEHSLKLAPQRFNSLYGAASAAKLFSRPAEGFRILCSITCELPPRGL